MYEKIDALFQKLKELPPLKPFTMKRLMEDFTVCFTYHSNAIEGSTLTEFETRRILQEGISAQGKPLRFQLDADGHWKAFLRVQELAAKAQPLTEEDIKAIHRLLLISNINAMGHYRDADVYINGMDVAFPSAEKVPERMRKLVEQYNTVMQEWHIVKRVSMFHLMFESIHPFLDGNGRTGRLLINYDLLQHGYPPVNIRLEDRERYYCCLQMFQGPDENELPMLQMISEYIENALNERLTMAEREYGMIQKQPER